MRKATGGLLLTLLLATACAGPPTAGGAAQPTDLPAAMTATAEMAATEAATLPAQTALPTETRAPRTALEATDPSTVSLAAGELQLVEFFAFW